MRRIAIMLGTVFAGALVLRAVMAADVGAQTARRPPNFIIILADDQPTAAAASSPQLYNLDQDPSEKFDVAEKHPELMIELCKVADEHQKPLSR